MRNYRNKIQPKISGSYKANPGDTEVEEIKRNLTELSEMAVVKIIKQKNKYLENKTRNNSSNN